MSIYIHKSHNVTVMMYHVVCPTKYRRVVINAPVEEVIKETCLGIEQRYDMHFLEIGCDKDHVHFLIQSVPMMLPQRIVQTVKSITAKEEFRRLPGVKKQMWGGEFWTDGYYMSTVGKHGNEQVIGRYVKEQGREGEYVRLHKNQLKLF
jgi:putative transposase